MYVPFILFYFFTLFFLSTIFGSVLLSVITSSLTFWEVFKITALTTGSSLLISYGLFVIGVVFLIDLESH